MNDWRIPELITDNTEEHKDLQALKVLSVDFKELSKSIPICLEEMSTGIVSPNNVQ